MSDTLVNVENVSKKFCRSLKRSLWYGLNDLGSELTGRNDGRRCLRKQEFWAIENVSLELKRGESLGLIGRNGAGKTTLFRMLNGLIKPDTGRIEVRGRMQALIALGAGFNPILSGRENIYINASVLGISKAKVDTQFDEIVEFSGIEEFIDTPVQSYSSGMQVRLGFAVAAHMQPDILLVDEVLAVGDDGFKTKCLNKIGQLKREGTAIILVSHNMHTISTFSQKIVLLDHGRHQLFDNASEGIRAYKKLFTNEADAEVQQIHSGNEKIKFSDAVINERKLSPGDSFGISLKYKSLEDYPAIEIDITLNTSNDASLYFQATNKAYNKDILLKEGEGELAICIEDIPIQNALGKIGIAVWSKDRIELLLWWEIPVEFNGANHSVGNNFLNVAFEASNR